MNEANMKEDYFKKLKALSREIDGPTEPDRDKMNSILYKAEEIVAVLNLQRSNHPSSRRDLLLDEQELAKLRGIIDEIWDKAERLDLVPRPKPDINVTDLSA